MGLLTIGRLAAQAEVHVETVRYYERRGLMPAPPRLESGYRAYPPESLTRIRFIKSAQALGFTLEEIKHLLALRMHADSNCEQVRRQAEQKLTEIAQKIEMLRHLQQALTNLAAACVQDGPQGECPILEALEEQTSWKKGCHVA